MLDKKLLYYMQNETYYTLLSEFHFELDIFDTVSKLDWNVYLDRNNLITKDLKTFDEIVMKKKYLKLIPNNEKFNFFLKQFGNQ